MKKGFTLVEVLIAISIFTISAVIATSVLVDVVQLEKKSSIQTGIYEDIRIILQQITNEVQEGTIDYEEYYNVEVLQGENLPEDVFYGINYGVYGSRFYDPGRIYDPASGNPAGTNPEDLGIDCSVLNDDGGCDVIFTHSSDLNTGKHPYDAADSPAEETADAFCDNMVGDCTAERNIVDELYLIDNSGRRKTIIGKKLITQTGSVSDYAVGLMRMEGEDLDQNGLIDVFACTEDFNCVKDSTIVCPLIKYPFAESCGATFVSANEISLPKQDDLRDPFNIYTSQFIPISPFRSNIENLKFIINPMEDPYKAYAEENAQSQPSVTIILTIGLSSETAADYPGTFQPITVQTTVAAGVLGKIDSYPSVNDYFGRASWICDVLPGGLGDGCS